MRARSFSHVGITVSDATISLIGSGDGRLYLLRLSDGKRLWSHDLGQPIGASPAVTAGRVILGAEDGRVYAFGPSARSARDRDKRTVDPCPATRRPSS